MPISQGVELKTPEKKEWPLIPEDVYQVEITDLVEDVSDWMGKPKEVFKFEFTIIEPGEFYGRKLWKRGARVSPCPSDNNKAPLTWKVASAVIKHPLTKEEGTSFSITDMNNLIGKQLRVGVSVTAPKPDGKQYNNIENFLMAKQNLPAFDESNVTPGSGEPVKPQKLTPAEIVSKASGGKFAPRPAPSDSEDVEFGEVDSEDVPY